MSVEKLSNISNDAVNSLIAIKDSIVLSSARIRVGKNKHENISVYKTSKWFDWTADQMNTFKSVFSESHVNKAVSGWFLHLPENTGHLDEMDYWQDKPYAGTVVAYSLTNGNSIVINDVEYTCNAGEGIKFSLKELHKINKTATSRDWACLMLLQ